MPLSTTRKKLNQRSLSRGNQKAYLIPSKCCLMPSVLQITAQSQNLKHYCAAAVSLSSQVVKRLLIYFPCGIKCSFYCPILFWLGLEISHLQQYIVYFSLSAIFQAKIKSSCCDLRSNLS